jgi:4-carboxymuconolactone decarboxylase
MTNETISATGEDAMKGATSAAMALALATAAEAEERRSVAPPAMQKIAPALAGYTDDVLFGDVWVRPDLSPRDRSMVTLSVLVATGKTAQLSGHLARGLTNGVTPVEIAGMVTQFAFYTGWPNAVSALSEIEKVFAERGIDAAAPQTVDGPRAALPASDAARAASVQKNFASVAPKFADLTNQVVFRDLWRRTDLSPRDRSLVTIAALAAGGDGDQLRFHIGLGLENGLTEVQVGEALTHLAFYAGWVKASAAIGVAAQVTAQRRDASPAGPVPGVRVTPPGRTPAAGPASYFTGSVAVTSAFKGTGGARLGGGTVTFQPGAHTNWHTHPLGQLLIVTAGHGWVQADGEPVRAMASGDTVWIGPGVRHWHGATRTSGMTHVAVSEAEDGKSVDWLEPVTDQQYHGPA